jgi:hypothetical protein
VIDLNIGWAWRHDKAVNHFVSVVCSNSANGSLVSATTLGQIVSITRPRSASGIGSLRCQCDQELPCVDCTVVEVHRCADTATRPSETGESGRAWQSLAPYVAATVVPDTATVEDATLYFAASLSRSYAALGRRMSLLRTLVVRLGKLTRRLIFR